MMAQGQGVKVDYSIARQTGLKSCGTRQNVESMLRSLGLVSLFKVA